jgi:hypothetical protein
MRTWSALVPIGMSFAALTLVVGHFLRFGIVHETDEGTAAHVFQLLIVLQVPIVAYFGIARLPRAPREGLIVLSTQGAAIVAACASVYFLT